jgi:hypothetical protein
LHVIHVIQEGSMRMLRFTSLALAGIVAAVLVTPAPAAAQGDNPKIEIKPTNKVKRDKYIITADEIAEHPDLVNGYDAVKILRNQWLRVTRGTGGALGSTIPGGGRPVAGCSPRSTDPYCTAGAAAADGRGSGGGGTSPVPHESGSPYAESGASMDTPGQAGPVLYIDEIKQEKLDQLKNLRPAEIFEMRFLTGTLAVGRYGTGHENGAILVKTMKFGKG